MYCGDSSSGDDRRLIEIKIVVPLLQNFKNSVKILVSSMGDGGLWWLFLAEPWIV